MLIFLDFVSGLTFGLEHIAGDEEDEFTWAIALHLGIVRVVFMKVIEM